MSWSIEVTGTKLGAAKKVAAEMDKIAANYSGQAEAGDVLAVKERLLAIIDASDLSDGYFNCVVVKANGSHATGAKGLLGASCTFSVSRTAVQLDPA